MTTFNDLPEEWVVWNDEPEGKSILVYRPDVFDTEAFPAECLPTIHVTHEAPNRPRGERTAGPITWRVLLYLEPDVVADDVSPTFESRPDAVASAVDVARQFADGEIDYRALYQVPREPYFEKLDELTGRDA